jgi:multisubunit Na+/H+ antiporter MnhB subunit
MEVDHIMPKNILVKTVASAGAGGVVYGIVVILLNYFAPIVGIIAGFVGGAGLVILGDPDEADKKDISPVNLFYFAGVAIISLLIGYILIYYFKTEIIHSISYHPKDFITLMDFIVSTLGIPDILSTVTGSFIAYSLSNKISAVYRYFRLNPPV